MAHEHREEWLWREEHPYDDAGAWEAEQRRLAEQADPETQEAFENLHSLAAILDATAALIGTLRRLRPARGLHRQRPLGHPLPRGPGLRFDAEARARIPEKQSGKTRTLEVLELITPCPRHGVNLSAAA